MPDTEGIQWVVISLFVVLCSKEGWRQVPLPPLREATQTGGIDLWGGGRCLSPQCPFHLLRQVCSLLLASATVGGGQVPLPPVGAIVAM